eukprot:m.103140 g.103140  ORF g.103140 m.103140 type:complete len:89 (-) comp10468_c0_seq1:95-361(-)
MCDWFLLVSQCVNTQSYGDPPDFVWSIIFILFIIDGTFAVAQFLQQMEIGPFKDYLYGEYWFIILSFTSKQLLAWINYGGTNSLNNDA